MRAKVDRSGGWGEAQSASMQIFPRKKPKYWNRRIIKKYN